MKIHEDVWVVESEHQVHGRRIRATARLRDDRIEDIVLTSDPPLHTAELARLEQQLRGATWQQAGLHIESLEETTP